MHVVDVGVVRLAAVLLVGGVAPGGSVAAVEVQTVVASQLSVSWPSVHASRSFMVSVMMMMIYAIIDSLSVAESICCR